MKEVITVVELINLEGDLNIQGTAAGSEDSL